MNRTFRAMLLTSMIVSSIGIFAEDKPAIAPPATDGDDACPAPLRQEPGPAIRLSPRLKPQVKRPGIVANDDEVVTVPGPVASGSPTELRLTHARGAKFDLRTLPQTPPVKFERPEHELPDITPTEIQTPLIPPGAAAPIPITPNAPAPSTIANFDGLDFATWGAGHPPDTNGDAGPTYYIQTINTSIGVFRKSDGVRVAAFTFNTFMSQGHFGNLCDTNNFGDPVVLYDSFEDRWIITDFAFTLDGSGNVINPPGNFQCVAASMSGDPVSGGWNFYSINTAGGLGDYPKFGIWPDGLYMSANMFQYASGGSLIGARVYAFNKAQMYAGAPSVQVVTFDAPIEFTLLPANARLQNGSPPPGSPNYYGVVYLYTNAVSVYKLHVNWNALSTSTFTGPFITIAPASWANPPATITVPAPGTALDPLPTRLMVQNQYTNTAGVESLWMSHTVQGSAATVAAPRYYQVNVTGGTVAATTTQAFTHTPDATVNRWVPSVALDRAGDMAMGYSAANAATFPSLRYAGRLATDPVNSLPQTETLLMAGGGTQTGNCGAGACARWGDYSAMTLDPNGCTFWYTNEYFATNGLNFLTRIGSFAFPSCTPVGAGGTLQGTVTAVVGGAPLVGATVNFGARSTTTNGSGFYSFSSIPAGTYPTLTVSQPGFVSQTVTSIVITDAGTTTDDFALAASAASGCLTDTTQSDFQTGVPTTVDLLTSPGDVILLNAANIDQQNLTVTPNGFGVTSTSWAGQTFTPAVTGKLTRVDIDLFCSGCTGTTPNITVSIRATTGATPVPTGADLATATIPGFNSGAGGYFTANFGAPPTLTAGTRYAIVFRAVSNPSAGTYAYVCSCAGSGFVNSSPYASGQRVTSANSGATWAADVTSGGRDLGFVTYMQTGFPASGNQISGLKDSNPIAGLTPIWSTLSWTATTPANTSVQFQVAGSNSPNGPFNFVGPNGTSATFFTTSGASLSQFYGLRYLEYKAILSSTDNTKTPTLSDVTICFADTDCSGVPAITPTPAQVCSNSTGNTANGPAGETSYAWTISNGSITGGASSQTVTYTAGASGSVGLTLNVVEPGGCHKSNLISVPIVPLTIPTIAISNVQTVTLTGGAGTFTLAFNGQSTSSLAFNATAASVQSALNALSTIGGAGGSVGVTLSAGVYTVTFGGTLTGPQPQLVAVGSGGATALSNASPICASTVGNQASGPAGAATYAWSITNGTITSATNIQTITYTAGASGTVVLSLTVTATCGGGSVSANVPINPLPPTPTITPGGPTTFCTGGSVTLTSSSASGNQWYLNGNPIGGATNQAFIVTASGDYTVIVTDVNNCVSVPSAITTVTVNPIPATPTVTLGGPTTFCAGGSVTLTSSSASGNQWYLNGNPIGGATNQAYIAAASGDYTVIVTLLGCSSSASTITTVTVNPIPATPTITPGGPTTFCAGGSVTLTSSSASGNQWYLNGNPIGGAINQNYSATASGNYTVVVTSLGCSSAPSAITAVTVNPIPPTPTVTPGGPTTFCAGDSVMLTSSSATGNQWYVNGNPIGGATNQAYVATASGDYTVTVTTLGCVSSPSTTTTVTVNPIPATPTITPGGPTTFCTGGSVTLTSSSATGNQWSLNGNPIGGATNQNYSAVASGDYTVIVTTLGCSSPASSSTTVTVNSTPFTPTITPGGPTTFCTGGSVTLTSSGASGNQWSLNGNPIGGATNQNYSATASGNYTVVVTTSGCVSNPSAITTVTVNPIPATPTITPGGPTTFCAGGSVTLTSSSATGNQWYLNGNPIGGATNPNYSATASGNYTVIVTSLGCSSAPSSATTVTVNPIPATPTTTPGGPTTFCAGGSVTLTSSSASGNQWSLNGNPIGGATNQAYNATGSGDYTVIVTSLGCSSAPSAATTVTVNPIPATPTITPGGPTTFCAGGSVTLTSSSASGNQWSLNGNPIGGATNQAYSATASGNYTVIVTSLGCSSAPSAAATVTVNPIPATPAITPGGPTTFCAGGSVTLTSSSATGNQWYSNGNPIGGANNQTYIATVAADYTVAVTTLGCSSAASAATTVTVNPLPNATITAPAVMASGSSASASVANAGVGATYTWGITNGSITGGSGTPSITFTAGAIGTTTLNVTVTTAANCSDTKSANITIGVPVVTVTSVVPGSGRIAGGSPITINGTGFESGATVSVGGSAATSVVFVSSIKLTAHTPAHAAGQVNVTVTNPDTSSGTLNNGFTYIAQQFDANGDNTIDPSDIFFLVDYLFGHGPAPQGAAGMLSGDANGDGLVDPTDIFYVINYLFTGGPVPDSTPFPPRVTTAVDQPFRGALSLGEPATRDGHTYIPVILTMAPGSPTPQAIALKLLFGSAVPDTRIHRAGAAANATTSFEISRPSGNGLSYLVAFDQKSGGLSLGTGDARSAVIAEVEVGNAESLNIEFDPTLTLLSDASGTRSATVANGTLQVSGFESAQHPGTKRPGIN